jgi:putative restriction endonuclease
MPWPLNRIVESADEVGDPMMIVNMTGAAALPQAVFLPVETLLCLAVSFLVNHRRFGGSTAHLAPEPIPSLARLFSRPPSSILAKMANLDGSRSHGGKHDILAGALRRAVRVLRAEPGIVRC